MLKVQHPPPKPLLIYDGNCHFCRYWANRWHRLTGDTVDYLPLQEPRLADLFPEISRLALESAVHFIEPDGKVSSGAQAVFRLLAERQGWRWLGRMYAQSKLFETVSESVYHFVSRHRSMFSRLWGTLDV